MKPPFSTALGERISRPTVVKTQARPNENTSTRAIAAITPGAPPSGRNPSASPTATTTVPATV